MEPFIYFVKENCLGEKIEANQKFSKSKNLLKDNVYYLKFIINLIKTYINAEKESKNNGKSQNSFSYNKAGIF